MRSLSRVIKADSFSLSSPKVIDPGPKELSCSEVASKSEAAFDTAAAQEIIVETEGVVQQLLQEAQERAEEIVRSAHLEAEEALQEAQEKCTVLEEEARKKGYQKGLQAGQKALAGERERVREQFDQLKAAIKTEIKGAIQQLEPELVELAQVIARQVLHTELTTSPTQVVAIARAAITRAKGAGEMVLKINARDYDAITGLLARDTPNGSKIRVEVDNSLQGGCLIETLFGTVDGTIDGQLQEIAHNLEEVSCCD